MRFLILLLLSFTVVFATIKLPENFQANFTQTITNPKKKVIHYSGKISFSDISLLKWEYLEPTKKETCTNGFELLVVDHDLEQVSNYLISKGFDLSKITQKAKLHSENIYVAEYEGKKYTIQLDHKKQLQSVAFFDDLDNKVQILFTDMKYGKGKLPSETMKCNYPKSYDIIRD